MLSLLEAGSPSTLLRLDTAVACVQLAADIARVRRKASGGSGRSSPKVQYRLADVPAKMKPVVLGTQYQPPAAVWAF
jgi:hypothetical protein